MATIIKDKKELIDILDKFSEKATQIQEEAKKLFRELGESKVNVTFHCFNLELGGDCEIKGCEKKSTIMTFFLLDNFHDVQVIKTCDECHEKYNGHSGPAFCYHAKIKT